MTSVGNHNPFGRRETLVSRVQDVLEVSGTLLTADEQDRHLQTSDVRAGDGRGIAKLAHDRPSIVAGNPAALLGSTFPRAWNIEIVEEILKAAVNVSSFEESRPYRPGSVRRGR